MTASHICLNAIRPSCFLKWSIVITIIIITTIFIWSRIGNDLPRKMITKVKNQGNETKLKYVLLWNDHIYASFHDLGPGQGAFKRCRCPVQNCFITKNRNLFDGDITKFNAISFTSHLKRWDIPKLRSPHQKYIFYEMESSDNYPVCKPMFDRFFNWTFTYKLNSDLPYLYILIRNIEGNIVGPKRDMIWLNDMKDVQGDLLHLLRKKTKAAAWFVSKCVTKNEREIYASALGKELLELQLSLDVYGCGPLNCPRNSKICNEKLKNDYYFYLSFENSFAEDYVTEKLTKALFNSVVPIVYGGANYSRFLPSGSYINAREHTPKELAALMYHLIKTPDEYKDFFRWRNHYIYYDPAEQEDVCNYCAVLNDEAKFGAKSLYKDFRKWWHPSFVDVCK